MDPVTVAMGASLEDPKDQFRERSSWRKSIYVVTKSQKGLDCSHKFHSSMQYDYTQFSTNVKHMLTL